MTLSESSKRELLEIARKTLASVLAGGDTPQFDVSDSELLEKKGVFVTVKKGNDLRGCIGCFTSEKPLYQAVQEMSVASALRDPRFPAARQEELEGIRLEISVLSALTPVRDPGQIVLGQHGILIRKGSRSGCFLPQVAQETGWSLDQFLGHCSRDKAGLGWEGWKVAEIFVFTVDFIREEERVKD